MTPRGSYSFSEDKEVDMVHDIDREKHFNEEKQKTENIQGVKAMPYSHGSDNIKGGDEDEHYETPNKGADISQDSHEEQLYLRPNIIIDYSTNLYFSRKFCRTGLNNRSFNEIQKYNTPHEDSESKDPHRRKHRARENVKERHSMNDKSHLSFNPKNDHKHQDVDPSMEPVGSKSHVKTEKADSSLNLFQNQPKLSFTNEKLPFSDDGERCNPIFFDMLLKYESHENSLFEYSSKDKDASENFHEYHIPQMDGACDEKEESRTNSNDEKSQNSDETERIEQKTFNILGSDSNKTSLAVEQSNQLQLFEHAVQNQKKASMTVQTGKQPQSYEVSTQRLNVLSMSEQSNGLSYPTKILQESSEDAINGSQNTPDLDSSAICHIKSPSYTFYKQPPIEYAEGHSLLVEEHLNNEAALSEDEKQKVNEKSSSSTCLLPDESGHPLLTTPLYVAHTPESSKTTSIKIPYNLYGSNIAPEIPHEIIPSYCLNADYNAYLLQPTPHGTPIHEVSELSKYPPNIHENPSNHSLQTNVPQGQINLSLLHETSTQSRDTHLQNSNVSSDFYQEKSPLTNDTSTPYVNIAIFIHRNLQPCELIDDESSSEKRIEILCKNSSKIITAEFKIQKLSNTDHTRLLLKNKTGRFFSTEFLGINYYSSNIDSDTDVLYQTQLSNPILLFLLIDLDEEHHVYIPFPYAKGDHKHIGHQIATRDLDTHDLQERIARNRAFEVQYKSIG